MKSWLLVYTLLLASEVAAVAADLPSVSRRSTTSDGPSISVSGEAEEQVRPDLAVLSLEAADDKPTATEAAIENAQLTRALIGTLQTYGLSGSDIQAGSLDLYPQYKDRLDPKSGEVVERIFTGYRASTMFRVSVSKIDDAPRIAREMVESGTNSYRSVTFELRDRDDRLDALRAKALKNALQRAQRYAASAALKLGDIIRIMPEFREASSARDPDGSKSPLGQVVISVPSRVNDIKLHAAVTVSWELRPQTAECEADTPRK